MVSPLFFILIMSFTTMKKYTGFTLLELMLVVGIMAIVGSVIVSSFGGSGKGSIRDNATVTAARYEMEQLRQALLRYQRDNHTFPDSRRTPADVSFLFEKRAASSWQRDYQTGWRGPYLSGGENGNVDIGDDLQEDGSGSPVVINTHALTLIRAIPDPFAATPVTSNDAGYSQHCNEIAANTACLLDWRYLGQDSTDSPISHYGRPYLLFNLNDPHARIVSMGRNGKKDSDATGDSCKPKFSTNDNNDDLVLCLY